MLFSFSIVTCHAVMSTWKITISLLLYQSDIKLQEKSSHLGESSYPMLKILARLPNSNEFFVVLKVYCCLVVGLFIIMQENSFV